MTKYLKEILYILGTDKKNLPFLFVFFVLLSILDLIGLGIVGPYISIIINPGSIEGFYQTFFNFFGFSDDRNSIIISLGFILLTVFALKAAFAIIVNGRIVKFSQDQQLRLRRTLMASFQSLDYAEYLKKNSSEYIYSIQQLSQQYGLSVLLPSLRIISDLIVGLVIIIFLAIQNLEALALLIFLLSFFVFFYDSVFRLNIKKFGEKANKASTLMLKAAQEGLEGFKEIRVLGKEDFFFNQLSLNAQKFAKYSAKSQILALTPKYLLELSLVMFIVILVSGTLFFGTGELKSIIPTLALFGVAALRLLPSANLISTGLVQLRFSRDAVRRLYEDIKLTERSMPEINISKEVVISDASISKFKQLRLENISFRYENSKNKIISNLSLEIYAGQSIGFIGVSGSGKTTLIDLILGLLRPQKGEIFYNDQPIIYSQENWKSKLAYLPQQMFLIDNSLAQNIALEKSKEKIDYKKIMESIRKAQLTDLVNSLENGVDTHIGERGIRLSGGQRQRIALARAFYHEKEILILDESTSALDAETENEIVREIERLKGVKTTLVIAHKLSTLQQCDKVFELHNGKIVNSGTYKEVVLNKI